MSAIRTLIAAVALAAIFFVSPAAAAPGDLVENVNNQTCSKGCVAGLLVMAAIISVVFASLMCFIFWPAAELTSRQEGRAIARKRIRDRRVAEEESRAKNEVLDGRDV
ncbi:hypothetical protein LDHU3_18.1290:CDS1 [Leishmania donovani]|uniref:Hypothetical_protein n=2 Tax=Leishmania donovani species complex TaxID=38574 RepID=A0A6L0X752_LEIIN|nr:hypothetical protein CGC21_3060 [Leishmania donovani]CAC9480968.1 hypothetical_protein [Leishmania infantum]TPP55250.1 hypothetical protein CGC20_39255 [Leishmania donovani]CAJ1988048.1 hypothetical protein LDHU3_18.1290:CDS1 [Leishmania donovani]SUZ41029.1 hypothetical_protein [Leishmania infantum]